MEKSHTLTVASREAGLVAAREEGASAFLQQEPAITIGSAKEPEASILAERELGLLFDDKILNLIVTNTNVKITQLSKTASFSNHIDTVELNAFLGLLYLNGVFKSGNEDAKGLWNADGTDRDIFRATMSLDRFRFLLTTIRFDDPAERELRKENGDRTAAISEIFE
ncbi:hypothetical protein ANN_26978 [Periplaneta americana]|uniref:PiggyBac transposable element-derived protein domain-containing protein n=1 Tax=Periplaneta americana TaxID=6978 RepID=A0ABQ8RWY2_PERAM|nr:hypothetical protein ANN_26978 [Periplaneta americana]